MAANRAVAPLLVSVTPALTEPPVNVLRLSLHPHGLAPRIANLSEWRAHLLARLRHQIDLTADPILIDLLHELGTYPAASTRSSTPYIDRAAAIAVPLQLRTHDRQLTFLSTTMLFGTPIDVTLSELAIEAFFPADAETAQMMRQMVDGHAATGSREAACGNNME